MNRVEKLLTLIDGVAVGKENLRLNSQPGGGFLSSGGLLALIVVVLSDERDDKAELFHVFPSKTEKKAR